ncbi:plasmid mobilization protein [Lactococcus garvieae]|uniref:plasmid mobilization protein n=1 Tax=Lactococcus garvieae TaxID=1363 RepID=UPI003851A789
MSEQSNLASNTKRIANRKDKKQISFRVSESEYLKLEQSAKVLNISVAAFAKKKAQGVRVVAPKISPEDSKVIARNLSSLGNNVNQIARKVNSFDDLSEDNARTLSEELREVQKELRSIWQQLT